MKSLTVCTYLESRGFKHQGPLGHDSKGVVANYFRVPRERTDLPDCLCNETPPQVCIQEHFFRIPGNDDQRHHSFLVSITNEAPQGWIDFKVYGLSKDDILTRLDEITEALFNAWKAIHKERE